MILESSHTRVIGVLFSYLIFMQNKENEKFKVKGQLNVAFVLRKMTLIISTQAYH